jgi:2',3'-cyclic-nucleotide 2'-phosphodiesterase
MGLKILVIGDVVGRPGREVIRKRLPGLIDERGIDFVVANGENAADGSGIIPAQVAELTRAGVDVITTGDHIWKRAEIAGFIRNPETPLLRPANYPDEAAGQGFGVFTTRSGRPIAVVNLIGRIYMNSPADCPFHAADRALKHLPGRPKLVVVDMHAEATSEKVAMGWHLDGRVTAVFGTHTHVPTADACLRPAGTAYITDVGMTGPYKSVLGRRVDRVLPRFINGMFYHFDVATEDVRLCGALIEADPETGKALTIERIELPADSE